MQLKPLTKLFRDHFFDGPLVAKKDVDVGQYSGRSLIFDDGLTHYLSRTFSAPTDLDKWTLSVWIKRGGLTGVVQNIFSSTRSGNEDVIQFTTTNTLEFRLNGNVSGQLFTLGNWRDTNAFTHLMLVYDAQNGTAADRAIVYKNGIRQEVNITVTFSTSPTLDLNQAVQHQIGINDVLGAATDFDGLMADFYFIDGQALTPASFGKTSLDTEEWIPIAYTGPYGNNGFHLDFSDTTSFTTLGADTSGNANNWTLNNYSGTTTDWAITDTPIDSYCVLNPLDHNGTNIAHGGLRWNSAASSFETCRASMPVFDGCYWEFTRRDGAGDGRYGLKRNYGLLNSGASNDLGVNTNGEIGYNPNSGNVYKNNVAHGGNPFATVANNATGCFAYKNGKLYLGTISGTTITWVNSGDPVAETGEIYSSLTLAEKWMPAVCETDGICEVNFGQRGFIATNIPAGYVALSSANMATPINKKITSLIQIILASGDNIETNLANARAGWPGYIEWIKDLDTVESPKIRFGHDSANEYVIGATATYQAKAAFSGAQDHEGIAIKIDPAFGTAAGSVSHTNGVDTTVTHSLGLTSRTLVLLFPRANGEVYLHHPENSAGKIFIFTGTAAEATSGIIKNVGANSFDIDSTHPTDTYDYLVIAETALVSFNLYTGNGSTSGPMDYHPGRPVMHVTKNRGAVGGYRFFDEKRSPFNERDERLWLEATTAEDASGNTDMISNGVKVRDSSSSGETNTGSGLYCTIAFIVPINYARAI